MTLTREQIRAAAMELNAAEREELAEELLRSIDGDEQQAIDAAWLAEARRRDAAIEAGQIRATPVDEVVERLKRRA